MKNHLEYVQRNKEYETLFWKQVWQRLQMDIQNRQGGQDAREGCNYGVFFIVNNKDEYNFYNRQIQELQQQYRTSVIVVNEAQRTPNAAARQPGRAGGAEQATRAADDLVRGTQPQNLALNRAPRYMYCTIYR